MLRTERLTDKVHSYNPLPTPWRRINNNNNNNYSITFNSNSNTTANTTAAATTTTTATTTTNNNNIIFIYTGNTKVIYTEYIIILFIAYLHFGLLKS